MLEFYYNYCYYPYEYMYMCLGIGYVYKYGVLMEKFLGLGFYVHEFYNFLQITKIDVVKFCIQKKCSSNSP